MKLGFVTTDDVNAALAARLAADAGLDLTLLPAHRPAAPADCDGVIYDLDFLPAHVTGPLLNGWCSWSGTPTGPSTGP